VRVAVVGAGALGCTYAARLALHGDCDVSLVARSAHPPESLRLERVETGAADLWESPARLARVPPDADVVLLCVRYDQLGAAAANIGAGAAPVVVLTPLMPADAERLRAALPGGAARIGARIVAGMPSVVAYRRDAPAASTIRYWMPRAATTWIDDRRPADGGVPGAEVELVQRLGRAGIPAKVAGDVLARNAATTILFAPIVFALDVAGGVDRLLGDTPLFDLARRAVKETRALSRTVGRADAWASALVPLVQPWTVRAAIAIARGRAPEAVHYAEEHFGRKLRAQNRAMAAAILELARARVPSCPLRSLETLAARLTEG
jgi:ketopantoate reductase